MRTILVDFEDSFTFNISSELYIQGQEHEVIHFNDLNEILGSNNNLQIILGPGPGHPDEYKQTIALIRTNFQRKDIYWVGICLGHQLLWRALGVPVSQSLEILHGMAESIVLDDYFQRLFQKEKIKVQRYNSLCVHKSSIPLEAAKVSSLQFNHNDELMMSVGDNFISYQFHPE